jgi:uncharacterized cupin superfamily protein
VTSGVHLLPALVQSPPRTRRRPEEAIDTGENSNRICGFDLSKTYVHLGLGPTAVPLPEFGWDDASLRQYALDHETDGDEGRLVMIGANGVTWTQWERHPAGPELVVLLSGHVTVIQDVEGEYLSVELHPGEAVVNPKDVWHTADVHEPGRSLYITPGRGTQHRPRCMEASVR